jgi:hypothetical protein
MASEASASEKVVSESPQQQQPEPQKTTSPPHQPPSIPEPFVPEPSVPEPTVPEHNTHEPVAPEQPVLETTQSSTIPLPVQIVKITRYVGVSDMDFDSEDDQDDHASDMVIDPITDLPSTSQPLTTNGQSPSNQTIVLIAPPKPSKQPSPPTIFLDSQVLQDVWEDIASKELKLIRGRNDLGHTISYQKQWRRLKERAVYVISALHDSCIEAQEQAKQKLEEWLSGIEASSDQVEVLGTWVKNPLSLRGREPEDFLPKYIHPQDLDLSFLSKIDLSKTTPDLALAQENKVLKERNRELETELQEQKLKLMKLEADMEQARIREEKNNSEMDQKYAETQEILKKILENQNKPNL